MALARAIIWYTDRALSTTRPLIIGISRAMARTMVRAMAMYRPIVIANTC